MAAVFAAGAHNRMHCCAVVVVAAVVAIAAAEVVTDAAAIVLNEGVAAVASIIFLPFQSTDSRSCVVVCFSESSFQADELTGTRCGSALRRQARAAHACRAPSPKIQGYSIQTALGREPGKYCLSRQV